MKKFFSYKKRKGSLLVTIILIVIIFSVVSIGLFSTLNGEINANEKNVQSMQAHYIANTVADDFVLYAETSSVERMKKLYDKMNATNSSFFIIDKDEPVVYKDSMDIYYTDVNFDASSSPNKKDINGKAIVKLYKGNVPLTGGVDLEKVVARVEGFYDTGKKDSSGKVIYESEALDLYFTIKRELISEHAVKVQNSFNLGTDNKDEKISVVSPSINSTVACALSDKVDDTYIDGDVVTESFGVTAPKFPSLEEFYFDIRKKNGENADLFNSVDFSNSSEIQSRIQTASTYANPKRFTSVFAFSNPSDYSWDDGYEWGSWGVIDNADGLEIKNGTDYICGKTGVAAFVNIRLSNGNFVNYLKPCNENAYGRRGIADGIYNELRAYNFNIGTDNITGRTVWFDKYSTGSSSHPRDELCKGLLLIDSGDSGNVTRIIVNNFKYSNSIRIKGDGRVEIYVLNKLDMNSTSDLENFPGIITDEMIENPLKLADPNKLTIFYSNDVDLNITSKMFFCMNLYSKTADIDYTFYSPKSSNKKMQWDDDQPSDQLNKYVKQLEDTNIARTKYEKNEISKAQLDIEEDRLQQIALSSSSDKNAIYRAQRMMNGAIISGKGDIKIKSSVAPKAARVSQFDAKLFILAPSGNFDFLANCDSFIEGNVVASSSNISIAKLLSGGAKKRKFKLAYLPIGTKTLANAGILFEEQLYNNEMKLKH